MSRWTHAQCESCWRGASPGREPARLVAPPVGWCCFCGQPTDSGIYVRADPDTTLCKGEHREEVTDEMSDTYEEPAAEAEADAEAAEAEATEEAEAGNDSPAE